jgi:hypothetical protein
LGKEEKETAVPESVLGLPKGKVTAKQTSDELDVSGQEASRSSGGVWRTWSILKETRDQKSKA